MRVCFPKQTKGKEAFAGLKGQGASQNDVGVAQCSTAYGVTSNAKNNVRLSRTTQKHDGYLDHNII